MRLRYARLTTAGAVREVNQDYISYWESDDPLIRDKQGTIAALADGVGGLDCGEVASRIAVEEALKIFQTDPADLAVYAALRRIFSVACAKVYESGRAEHKTMATTLVVSIFRHHTLSVAHVGDSRAYHIRQKKIQRLTRDHVATALPVKLRLMHEREAMARPDRSQLTRSIGLEPFSQPDLATQPLMHGDHVVHCSDGLHAFVLDEEINQIVSRHHPYDACRELVSLAEKRGSDDNISLQIISVHDWEKVVSSSKSSSGAKVPAGLGEPAPGQVLDERFELTDLVARSNMASIFKATDRQTGEAVALKVPLMALESDVAGFERFKREEEIGTKLNHPAVLKVIKVERKSRPYLVMEFLDGETLSQLLNRQKPLPEKEAARYAAQICDALAYLHANGVTHRDLKPQNIMICRDGSLRLFDFGIAGLKQARRLTFVGFSPTMGTPDYMAPEQVKGKRGDHRTDIYSLGAILYEMATGQTPFQGESPYVIMNARTTGDPVAPRKLNPHLTPVLEEVILHALERDPNRRFASAADMKRELEDYEVVELIGRAQHLRSPETPGKSRQLWIMIAVVIAVQIVLFFGLAVFLRGRH